MIYFSEIKDKKVISENGVFLGKLEDFLFLATDNPVITKFIIQDSNKNNIVIPISFLKKINNNITVFGNYRTDELSENELFVVKNLLDKQIIDLRGNKIVRVNDVVIQDKPNFLVAGVEIGILGILRWLKLEGLVCKIYGLFKFLNIKIEPKLLSWVDIQPLELARGKVVLKKEAAKLNKIRPEDLAYYLNRTNLYNVSKIIKLLDDSFAAEVIRGLNINYQTDLFKHFPPEKAVKIISLIDPDEAVDILLSSTRKKREEIMTNLQEDKRKEIHYLLQFSKTPIGGLITSEFITVSPGDTVKMVIKKIQERTTNFSFMDYVYVVNEEEKLVGVFNLHELLLQSPEISVFKFMIQNVVVARLTTPEEIVIDKMLKYRIHAVPVIDKNKRILGIVTFDDVAEFLLKKIG